MSYKYKEEKQKLWIILLIVFISFIGTSIAYPIFPPLFLYPQDGAIIPLHWSEKTRSILLGIALAAYPLGQFLGSPILGGGSDRYGRKKMLIFSLAGSVLGYLMSTLALYFNVLWLLILSRFFTGFMESNFAIVRAMAADLESINKYQSMGRINGMAAIGYVIGPLVGGFLSDSHLVPWFSFTMPFFLSLILSILVTLLALLKMSENKTVISSGKLSLCTEFNLISRFKSIFQKNATLKYLLIISTIFTFSVDIFYEFGPIYLTRLWQMTPAQIALYNGALCFALALGAASLPHFLSIHFKLSHVIIAAMSVTASILFMMVILPYKILVFLLFALIGLSIATVNTNIIIQISNAADKNLQGEAMGAQLSLRTLGDAIICLLGAFLIVTSVMLPIAAGCFLALISLIIYIKKI